MLGMTGKLVFTALCSILFLLVLGISENAYAREYVAPPDVSISEIRDGEFASQVLEGIRQGVVEVPEPVIDIGSRSAHYDVTALIEERRMGQVSVRERIGFPEETW